MNRDEVMDRYGIPMKVLMEYHEWGLCPAVRMAMDEWQYTDADIERLGMIMALHDIGFSVSEVESFMRLLLAGEGTKDERMKMLNEKRSKALDEIHLKERQLVRMDYLRIQIRNG